MEGTSLYSVSGSPPPSLDNDSFPKVRPGRATPAPLKIHPLNSHSHQKSADPPQYTPPPSTPTPPPFQTSITPITSHDRGFWGHAAALLAPIVCESAASYGVGLLLGPQWRVGVAVGSGVGAMAAEGLREYISGEKFDGLSILGQGAMAFTMGFLNAEYIFQSPLLPKASTLWGKLKENSLVYWGVCKKYDGAWDYTHLLKNLACSGINSSWLTVHNAMQSPDQPVDWALFGENFVANFAMIGGQSLVSHYLRNLGCEPPSGTQAPRSRIISSRSGPPESATPPLRIRVTPRAERTSGISPSFQFNPDDYGLASIRLLSSPEARAPFKIGELDWNVFHYQPQGGPCSLDSFFNAIQVEAQREGRQIDKRVLDYLTQRSYQIVTSRTVQLLDSQGRGRTDFSMLDVFSESASAVDYLFQQELRLNGPTLYQNMVDRLAGDSANTSWMNLREAFRTRPDVVATLLKEGHSVGIHRIDFHPSDPAQDLFVLSDQMNGRVDLKSARELFTGDARLLLWGWNKTVGKTQMNEQVGKLKILGKVIKERVPVSEILDHLNTVDWHSKDIDLRGRQAVSILGPARTDLKPLAELLPLRS